MKLYRGALSVGYIVIYNLRRIIRICAYSSGLSETLYHSSDQFIIVINYRLSCRLPCE